MYKLPFPFISALFKLCHLKGRMTPHLVGVVGGGGFARLVKGEERYRVRQRRMENNTRKLRKYSFAKQRSDGLYGIWQVCNSPLPR
jgi:hypothetical protein